MISPWVPIFQNTGKAGIPTDILSRIFHEVFHGDPTLRVPAGFLLGFLPEFITGILQDFLQENLFFFGFSRNFSHRLLQYFFQSFYRTIYRFFLRSVCTSRVFFWSYYWEFYCRGLYGNISRFLCTIFNCMSFNCLQNPSRDFSQNFSCKQFLLDSTGISWRFT